MLTYVLVKYKHINRKAMPQIHKSGYLSGGGCGEQWLWRLDKDFISLNKEMEQMKSNGTY